MHVFPGLSNVFWCIDIQVASTYRTPATVPLLCCPSPKPGPGRPACLPGAHPAALPCLQQPSAAAQV